MVDRPALVILVFAAADQLDRDDRRGRGWLESVWESTSELGMNRPIDRVAPAGFPAELRPRRGFGVLASRESSARGIRQALIFANQDVVGMLLVLGSTAAHGWRSLWKAWTAATADCGVQQVPAAVIGISYLHLGVIPGTTSAGAAPIAGPEATLRSLMPAGRDTEFPDDWTRTGRGFLISEFDVVTAEPAPRARHLALLASAQKETELDEWVWSSSRGLPPFAGYLLHAAKVRHQLEVYENGRGFRSARQRVEQAVDELMQVDTADLSASGLRAAHDALALEQADTDALITARSRIRAMARTVEIALANMGAAVPEHSGDQDPASPFERDRLDAVWLRDLLMDDAEYLSATLERAEQIGRTVRLAVQQRQQQFQQQLTLLQTSVIGAALMALTAVQALQYRIPIPVQLQPPVIAAAAATALVLPGATIRWARGIGDDAPLRRADLAFLTLLGASLGWLATSVVSREWLHHLAGPCPTAVLAALGAAVFLAGGSAGLHNLRGVRRLQFRPRRHPGR